MITSLITSLDFFRLISWVINLFFLGAMLPQVLLNFRLKTTRGLSDTMLFGYFNGYITYAYYAFCFKLPLAYRVTIPLSAFMMLVMVIQRFVYDEGYKKEKKWIKSTRRLLALYLCNGALALLVLPFAFSHTRLVGNITGWIEILIWATYQIPQIFKINRNKSCFGYSFLLVTLVGLGNIIELIIAINLHFPVQTIVNGIRGIAVYVLLSFQFWCYREEEQAVCLTEKS